MENGKNIHRDAGFFFFQHCQIDVLLRIIGWSNPLQLQLVFAEHSGEV